MADDRLDDAIAAVTRAVERIEAVTRGAADEPLSPLPEMPMPPQPRMPPPPAFSSGSAGFAARPTTALGFTAPEPEVDPSWSDYEPPSEPEPAFAPEATHAPEPRYAPESTFAPQVEPPFIPQQPYPQDQPFMLQQQFEPEPSYAPPQTPFVAEQPFEPAPIPPVSVDASAEVHELVGRIVARTQALEDHLEAARELRSEIAELVSRLAAAAERDH